MEKQVPAYTLVIFYSFKIFCMNPGKLFTELAAAKPQFTPILYKDKAYTYEEINKVANSIAASLLDEDVKEKDVVAVILNNCPEFAFIYFACAKIGAIFSPIDAKLTEANIKAIAEDIRPTLCFVHDSFPVEHALHSLTKTINIA
jgi:acyl-CoA synthetase (AMP-forming)/AMP-acid ligase II